MKRAHYRCLGCGHDFRQHQGGGKPSAHAAPPDSCPECGHKWMKWINYEEFTR